MPGNKLRVLLIEDDYQLGDVVFAYLTASGLDVTHKQTAQEGLDAIASQAFDCLILDLTLPDEDGLVVLRKLAGNIDFPVIICSARGGVEDRITGLEFGATDYLPKPFSAKELLLRIRAHAGKEERREHRKDVVDLHHLRLDIDKKMLYCNRRKEEIHLTVKEFMILSRLASSPGRVYSRAELIDAVSGIEGPESERAMDVAITRLRKKVEDDPKRPQIIKTSVGFGYYIH